mmetsp:Transcript_8130/g.11714  ORF Transcript_8130/g.11714 Transcript_8130/m.11714 type:complete len:265 (+) Transcript_8130:118-912(+)
MNSCLSLVCLVSLLTFQCEAFVLQQPSWATTAVTTTKSSLFAKKAAGRSKSSGAGESATNDYDAPIAQCKEILTRAAETKSEDSELVLDALENLEKLMRKKSRVEGESCGQEILENLTGDWRLIFTTGTKNTQDRFKARINYFPLKAVQSFDSTMDPMFISNGIYWADSDFALVKFFGDFDFDLQKRKLEFDFDIIAPFGFQIKLNKGQAAEIGASTGLGSESNVVNAKRGRQAFFNWISADENIATARGGGGGLALWKRVKKE